MKKIDLIESHDKRRNVFYISPRLRALSVKKKIKVVTVQITCRRILYRTYVIIIITTGTYGGVYVGSTTHDRPTGYYSNDIRHYWSLYCSRARIIIVVRTEP